MVGSMSTPLRPGFRASRAFSTSWVTWSVLPVGCFSTIRSRPSPSLITASPIGGGKPTLISATSPSRKGAPLRKATVILARSSGASMAATCRTAIRWLGMSTNPPPETTEASVTALTTASSVTPLSRSRSGSTSTWYCRSRWPQIATFATPGIDISRGRIVHFARRVRSICESVFDETPIFSSRLVDDSGERITGLFAAAGSRAASTASRSCTTCRAAIRSVPSLRIRTTRREPQHRLRPDRLEPDRAVERVLQRHADQALDLLGRQPRRLGLDLDQGAARTRGTRPEARSAPAGCRRSSARSTAPAP